MSRRILPLAAMEKILRKGGAGRVSEEAKEALSVILEEIGDELASKAVKLAQHTGRTTVKGADVKLARK